MVQIDIYKKECLTGDASLTAQFEQRTGCWGLSVEDWLLRTDRCRLNVED